MDKNQIKVNALTKKSQITIFLLIIIILIIAFGFVFYISETVSSGEETSLDQIIDNFLQTSTFKYYAKVCLEDSLAKGLNKIGSQGGFIFQNESYSVIGFDAPYVEIGDINNHSRKTNVSIQIYSELNSIHKPRTKEAVPFYPCKKGLSSSALLACHKSYSHNNPIWNYGTSSFGTTKTPKAPGPNRITPDLYENIVNISGYYYYPADWGGNTGYAIQSQLESFIENKVLDCVNFSIFTDYNVTASNVSVNATFTSSNVILDVGWNISIKYRDAATSRVIKFFVLQPSKLLNMYTIWRRIIKADANNISFNMRRDGQRMIDSNLNDYAGLYVELFATPDQQHSVLRIRDSEPGFMLGENEFYLQSVIENRPPALDYVSYAGTNDYDFYVIEGETINIEPVAIDPDDDPIVSYDYSGWKADWDDYFSSPSCGGAPTTTFNYGVDYNGISPSEWEHSTNPRYTTPCLDPFYSPITHKCASYQTNCHDIGPHNITVTVTDSAGSRDFQLVRIFVDDKPWVDPRSYNLYDYNIPSQNPENELASIEDPYVINGSKNRNVFGGSILFRWDDDVEPFHIPSSGYASDEIIYLPSSAPDIMSMSSAFNTPGTHPITVEMIDSSNHLNKNTIPHQVGVSSCLPHRSDAAPYPFNDVPDNIADNYSSETNPFLANHTCCDGNSNILPDSAVCYFLEDYGAMSDFTGGIIGNLNGKLASFPAYDFSNGFGSNTDIYKRTLTAYCTGGRGNICGGNIEHSYQLYKSCPDAGKHPKCNIAVYNSAECVDVPSHPGVVCSQNSVGKDICCNGNGGCDVLC